MRIFAIVVGAALAGLLAAGPIRAQSGPHARHRAAPAARAPVEASGLGEIMALQQMRHLKLWFAGSAADWELAAYELDELKEGFDDVLHRFPTHEGVALRRWSGC